MQVTMVIEDGESVVLLWLDNFFDSAVIPFHK